jgi:hypothetical protein
MTEEGVGAPVSSVTHGSRGQQLAPSSVVTCRPEKSAADFPRYVRHLADDEQMRYMAWFYVFPSLTDTFGNAVLEGGPCELVRSHNSGLECARASRWETVLAQL